MHSLIKPNRQILRVPANIIYFFFPRQILNVCLFPENIHTNLRRVNGNSKGQGVSEGNILKESVKQNWNLYRGRGGGVQTKHTLCGRGMGQQNNQMNKLVRIIFIAVRFL